jgi:hypothetical protein
MVLELKPPSNVQLGACSTGTQATYPLGETPPTVNSPGEPTTSGNDGVEATCAITGKSSGYKVSAQISGPTLTASVEASVPRQGVGGGAFSANISIASRNLYTQDCSFHTDAPPLVAGKGEMHARFVCRNAQQRSMPGTACNLEGVLVLLRCDQE